MLGVCLSTKSVSLAMFTINGLGPDVYGSQRPRVV